MEIDKKRIEFLEYDLFKDEDDIKAISYLRHGGISKKPFDTLNLSSDVGDTKADYITNRNIVKKHLNVKSFVFPHQSHSNIVKIVTNQNLNKTFEADALVTKEKDIALGICTADCQAALFFDRENKVIASAHAGWKGLVQNIYKNVISLMISEFHSKPQNILVCISPSLGLKHSEFINYKMEFPKEFWKYKDENKHFDLKKIALDQLLNENILEKNIEISKECTFSNTNFFSYRREKKTGRNCSFIALI